MPQEEFDALIARKPHLVAPPPRVPAKPALKEIHPLTDEVSFRLVLPSPPSANRYWRSMVIKGHVRVFVSTEAKKYKEQAAAIARTVFRTPLTGPIGLILRIGRPAKRGDLSNRIKVLEDALNGIAYVDDDQIVDIHATRFESPGNGRVEVTVFQY